MMLLLGTPADEENDNGLAADTVWESEIGDSDLDCPVEEPVSEVKGEYFLCKIVCCCLFSLVLITKLAFETAGRAVPTTFAVLITTGDCLVVTDIPFTK